MINSKLQKFISEKSSVAEFCNAVGMTESGYYKMVKAHSLKVWALEKYSKYMKLPMSFWLQDDDNIMKEPLEHYGKMEIDLLRSQLKDKDKLIARLEKELERLEGKPNENGYAAFVQSHHDRHGNTAEIQ